MLKTCLPTTRLLNTRYAVTIVAFVLVFLQGFGRAEASTVSCEGTPALTANETLSRVYDEVQFLGIAVPDHLRLAPFDKLADFLKLRGLDPRLKTIAVEDSAEIKDLYEFASVHDIDYPEFEARAREKYKGINNQTKYVVDHVLPVLREMNRKRAGDPILMVPIDSMTTEAAFQIFAPGFGEKIRGIPASLSTDGIEQRFFGSISRERGTAANFKKLITDRFPGRKGIVIYHGAHNFKNLSAVGSDRIQGELIAKRTYLGWISMASHLVPELRASYKVVATDYDSPLTPPSYLIPEELLACAKLGESSGFIWSAVAKRQADLFTPKSFYHGYRAGTIEIVDSTKPVFDAIIVDR